MNPNVKNKWQPWSQKISNHWLIILLSGVIMFQWNWYRINQPLGQENGTINFNGKPVVPWEQNHHHQWVISRQHPGHIIYYQFDQNVPPKYHKIWLAAIHNWNQLHVINLQPKPQNNHGYKIELGWQPKSGYGDTHFEMARTNHNVTYFTNVHCYLLQASPTDLAQATGSNHSNIIHQEQINIAVHELGHALGFSHDQKVHYQVHPLSHSHGQSTNNLVATLRPTYHIMSSDKPGLAIPLGAHEKHALWAMYH